MFIHLTLLTRLKGKFKSKMMKNNHILQDLIKADYSINMTFVDKKASFLYDLCHFIQK